MNFFVLYNLIQCQQLKDTNMYNLNMSPYQQEIPAKYKIIFSRLIDFSDKFQFNDL